MTPRLNGWQRLWVVVSTLYLLFVAVFVAFSWPTAETTWHREEFIARLPADLRAHVDAAYDNEYSWKQSLKSGRETTASPRDYPPMYKRGIQTSAGPPFSPRFTLLSAMVSFPNRAILEIHVAREGDTEPDARVASAYWAIVEAEARAARLTTVLRVLLIWSVPCLSLYALGWSVGWVRRGFRGAST
jgi:hypothetical protein